MPPVWFRLRGYKHFDAAVGENFAKQADDPTFVQSHDWLPLIQYTKRIKRYKPTKGKTVFKERPIMYASHRDACILSRYAYHLTNALEVYYKNNGLSQHVIAYRSLGKSNYHFSAEAYNFCAVNAPCVVLCFDIAGFFDHLDHRILKTRLKEILGVKELRDDWYKVFRQVTCFKAIEKDALAAHPVFGTKLKLRTREPIATIAEIKAASILIAINENKFGIPQGTPISSALSNLYMIEVDKIMSSVCAKHGAMYQRYSDDILIACPLNCEADMLGSLKTAIAEHKLEIKDEKTERIVYDPKLPQTFQYLGFNVSPDGATIRPGSLAKQWRKAKRNIARIKRIGAAAVADGKAKQIYTKKLRTKLSPVGVRNFSSYARRSAKAFGSKKIVRQVMRLERMADQAIRNLGQEE